MKRLLNFLCIALFALVAFTSCSSDNEPKADNPLVGTWECAEEYDDEKDDITFITYTFTADNKVTFLEVSETNEVIEQVTGDYTYNPDTKVAQLLFTAFDEYTGKEEVIIDYARYIDDTTIYIYYDEITTDDYYLYKRKK